MYTDGFWINYNGITNRKNINNIIENSMVVNNNHINAVLRNPDLFNITTEEYRSIHDSFHEKYGLEGHARELIILIVTCANKWIRVRDQIKGILVGTKNIDQNVISVIDNFLEFLKIGGTIKNDKNEEMSIESRPNIVINRLESYDKIAKSSDNELKIKYLKATPDRYKKEMEKIFGVREEQHKTKDLFNKEFRTGKYGEETPWDFSVYEEFIKKYNLTKEDIERFITVEEYKILSEKLNGN